jgi:hypothetical protein
MGPIVDLKADRGEGFGAYLIDDDVAPLKVVSRANIACGFPAGDREMPRWPDAYAGGNLGAHPSFPDLRRFDRGTERLFAYHGTDRACRTHGWLPKLVGSLIADRDRVHDGTLVRPSLAAVDARQVTCTWLE